MTGPELAEELGVSYRQIDHWTSCGYIVAEESNPGSGVKRDYPPAEVRIAIVITRLVKAGMNPRRAAEYARQGKTGVIL